MVGIDTPASPEQESPGSPEIEETATMTPGDEPNWIKIQENTFTNWINQQLQDPAHKITQLRGLYQVYSKCTK